jgi:hypothetical protein
MGQSERQIANTQFGADVKSAQGNNPLTNFKMPFGAGDFNSSLDKLLNLNTQKLKTGAADATSTVGQNTAARMASQGITGGSLLNSQVQRGQTDIAKSFESALQDLLGGRAGQQIGVMQNANQNELQSKTAQTNALMSLLGLQGQAAGQAESQTWLSDLFSGVNAAAGFLNPLSKLNVI